MLLLGAKKRSIVYEKEHEDDKEHNESGVLTMDWHAARAHCKEKDWKWTLDLIDKYQKEMEELKDENVKLKRQLVLRSQLNK